MQNPNRFIMGLSDVGEIVDGCPSTPIAVPGVVVSKATLNEVEQTLTVDGAQTLTLPNTAFFGYMLFINGFKQSKSSYSVSGVTVTLPSSLNLLIGDVVSFVYITN